MERSTYPFPLAVNSSHHSHYHRFLLGADASILAPFPKPYCLGSLAGEFTSLAARLDLPRWRKLYAAAMPWVGGFGPEHYAVGNVPPHRPLPPEYGRPIRRYGAYDFVQIADPSVTALALVAGDQRVLTGFVALGDAFIRAVEPAARAWSDAPGVPRATGRFMAGQFPEPNNRWLMPFLHVHSRILNFTSHPHEPRRLLCLDPGPLARAAEREMKTWIERQADLLCRLGYRANVRAARVPSLSVPGVSDQLLTAVEAPRIAVLRLLQRLVGAGRAPAANRLSPDLPIAAIASMAGRLESLIACSLGFYRPPKLGLPSEGPWRQGIREHLAQHCPAGFASLEAAARKARAIPGGGAMFPTPSADAAHWHTAQLEALEAAEQFPTDPELGTSRRPEAARSPSAWLAREFAHTLAEVNGRVIRPGPADALGPFREMLAEIDQLAAGPALSQVYDAGNLVGEELDRQERAAADRDAGSPGPRARPDLVSIDDLFAGVCLPRLVCEPEIGGRSL